MEENQSNELQYLQNKLQDAENKLVVNESVLEQAIDAIVTIDGASKAIIFFNSAAERMWGYSREEVLGKNIKFIVPQAIQANHDDYVDANMNSGVNKIVGSSRDIEVERKDGSSFWASLALSKVTSNGKTLFTAFVKDISKQKEDQERINLTLEQALDGVVTIDGRTKEILFFNSAAERMWGYSREEVLGKNINYIVPPEHQAPHDGYVDANVNGGPNRIVGKSRDVEVQRKDGTRFWANLSISKVQTGETVLYTAFAKDVTQVREANEKAQALTDAVDSGWAMIEFHPDGSIIDANDNFLSGLEYSRAEVQGAHHRMFCDPSYTVSAEYSKFWQELSDGHQKTGEFERVTKSGKKIWIQASYTPIKNSQGRVYKVIKIATDITATKLPILHVKDIIVGMAEGDLTKVPEVDADGYVAEMADALAMAIRSLNDILSNIGGISTTVATSAEEMLSAGREMKSTTSEVASAIAQMSEGAAQTAIKTDESSKLVADVSDVAKDMSKKAEVINKAAQDGQESCASGIQTIKKVVNNMAEIRESAESTSDSINILTERSEEIARTLNVITEIAAQTNLLALNAAIEAARAGEAGRGFAVVAEEIRNLAENSRKSAVEIEKVIKEVQKDIAAATKQIDGMSGAVKSGNEASKEAEEVFASIEQSSSETLDLAKDIASASEGQMQSILGVVKNIESIVVVSEETATGAEQIAASSTELDSGMHEVSNNSQNLTELAMDLQDRLNKFTL